MIFSLNVMLRFHVLCQSALHHLLSFSHQQRLVLLQNAAGDLLSVQQNTLDDTFRGNASVMSTDDEW